MRRVLIALCLALIAPLSFALADGAARALHERQSALAAELEHSIFGLPIHLDSHEQGDEVGGDVYAQIDHPFELIASSMARPAQWCDVMLIVINIKRCAAEGDGRMTLNVGRKFDQPLQNTYSIGFEHRLVAQTNDYLRVELDAARGPFGTSDYRISLEAIPSDASGDRRAFVHLHYAYRNGLSARFAMQMYLSTIGRSKVGFSVVGRADDGEPQYVRGTRGAIERTTMRYYLAILAYLDSFSAPPQERVEKRLTGWYAATERYARQLHEIDREQYLALKHQDMARSSS